MTDIQVKFWANQEAMRSNRVQEALTSRDLSERERHNLVSERISAAMAAASQTQAAAAMRQAEVAKKMAELQARRVAIEERLESLNAAKLNAEAVYTRSKARSEYYNQLLTQQKTSETAANTEYLRSKTTTESKMQDWYSARTSESRANTVLAYAKGTSEVIGSGKMLSETITSWNSMPASIITNYGKAAEALANGVSSWITMNKKGGSN